MSILIFWDQQAPQGLQLPVARVIAEVFDMPVEITESPLFIKGYDRGRNQHNAQKILNDIQDVYTRQYGTAQYLLLVTPHDLFIPGRDFVFGLSRPPLNIAIVSTARLTNGYYGREERDDDAIDRIIKEGAHEIGHLMGLDHCEDPECIMFLPRTLDDLDRKRKTFCKACRDRLQILRHEAAQDREYR
jgi:archaemetzincin